MDKGGLMYCDFLLFVTVSIFLHSSVGMLRPDQERTAAENTVCYSESPRGGAPQAMQGH